MQIKQNVDGGFYLQTLKDVLTHSTVPSDIWDTLNEMELAPVSHPYYMMRYRRHYWYDRYFDLRYSSNEKYDFNRDPWPSAGMIDDDHLSECISIRKFVENVQNTTAIEVLSFDSYKRYRQVFPVLCRREWARAMKNPVQANVSPATRALLRFFQEHPGSRGGLAGSRILQFYDPLQAETLDLQKEVDDALANAHRLAEEVGVMQRKLDEEVKAVPGKVEAFRRHLSAEIKDLQQKLYNVSILSKRATAEHARIVKLRDPQYTCTAKRVASEYLVDIHSKKEKTCKS